MAGTYPRILGLLTLGYGAYTLGRPKSLLHAAGLESRDSAPTGSGHTLGRVIGTRDVLSGTAMLAAPVGVPLQAAVAARVACDVSDTVGFGLTVPPGKRAKVLAVTVGWALVCASSFWSAGRRS